MFKKLRRRGNKEECRAIGIDLGTTYSRVGVWRNSRVEIIPNRNGNRRTPSLVTFTQTECLVRNAARNNALLNPRNTIFEVKRLIGRRFTDKTVQSDIKLWPFKVLSCPTKDGVPMIVVTYEDNEKLFFAEEISSMVLMKMKEIAEAYLGFKVKDAVITVPANFNDSQRQATKNAGVIAGLNVMRILNEPTAAAIAYGLEKEVVYSNVLVFDLGGGTLDVSLVAIYKDLFEVKAVSGDTHLGGADFGNRLVSHFGQEFYLKHNKDINNDPRALGRVRGACERAKRALSFTSPVSIEVDCLYDDIDFSSVISRARFEELNIDLFEGCLKLVESCIRGAKMEKGDVDEIALVGGSTRIPKVQKLLQEYFNGKKPCKSLYRDEVVACGAAIQAAVLSGVRHYQHVMPVDVTPLSIGVELESGEFRVVIPENTPIPTNMEVDLTTIHENQTIITTSVYESERSSIAMENNLLGRFELCGITPAPSGIPSIIERFEIDTNGILIVKAEERSSGNTSQLNITKDGEAFSHGEPDRMVAETKKCIAGDIDKKTMTAKANLEKYVYRVSQILSEDCRGLKDMDKKKLKDAVDQTIQWLELKRGQISRSMFIIQLEELENICDPLVSNLRK